MENNHRHILIGYAKIIYYKFAAGKPAAIMTKRRDVTSPAMAYSNNTLLTNREM